MSFIIEFIWKAVANNPTSILIMASVLFFLLAIFDPDPSRKDLAIRGSGAFLIFSLIFHVLYVFFVKRRS